MNSQSHRLREPAEPSPTPATLETLEPRMLLSASPVEMPDVDADHARRSPALGERVAYVAPPRAQAVFDFRVDFNPDHQPTPTIRTVSSEPGDPAGPTPNAVTGTVWLDLNANEKRDPDEPGKPYALVFAEPLASADGQLDWFDTNANDAWDPGEGEP